MPNERISMSKLKQLIGLQSSNLSVRTLSRPWDCPWGAVSKYLRALRALQESTLVRLKNSPEAGT